MGANLLAAQEEGTMNRAGKLLWVASLAFVFVVSAFAVVPARGDTAPFTLYGGMNTGWGFTSASQTNPGPTITVTQGDTVVLTLHSIDANAITHDWFIDYDNNSAITAGEPASSNFSGNPAITYTFTADRVGTFTYRCSFHPAVMRGLIVVRTPPTFELYGSGTRGWGEQNTTASITKPGPTLVVNQSQTVMIDLTSADGQLHSWFIDLNNDTHQQTTEPHSNDFNASTRYTFTVTLAPGNYVYRCQYHPTMMYGTFTVRATGGGGGGTGGGIDTTLVIGGVVIVVAIVAVAAAVMMRRKRP
jgi:plastocyanin